MGCKKDESPAFFPDWATGTSGRACAGAYHPARKESSVAGGIGESAAENYGTWLCTVRVANTDVYSLNKNTAAKKTALENFV